MLDAAQRRIKGAIFKFFFLTLVIGLCFAILYPLLKILPVVTSDFSDLGNPDVIWIPVKTSLMSFRAAISLGFGNGRTMLLTAVYCAAITFIQIMISAFAGYSLGRVKFLFSSVVMVLVIVTIVTPPQALLISQYLRFKQFDVLGIVSLLNNGKPMDLINKPYVLYVLALTGFGVKQSIFVFIFRQFFSSLPMELEEAALIDGCGFYKTFFKIALPNAVPAITTVASLAFVWNYGDTYYTGYFHPDGPYIANTLTRIFADNQDNISKVLNVIQRRYMVPSVSNFVFDATKHAAALIYLSPLLAMYFAAQKKLVESFERSGIVG
ncbi:MAG: carbohydrate ABC transporter permease [Clostridiales bacterium]|jgi:multiple sugar transport system permease protein|nr:carbohydrate ABC transporter permease [Clostridiales bacterium]